MANRLTPLQRAYRLGYLRGLRRARADLRTIARNFDEELADLQDEVSAIDREYRNVRAVAEAMAERDPATPLH